MSHKFEATVDGIKFLYDGGEVEVDYNASNGDVVRLTIEPLEVKVTDGFRAAVKNAAPAASGLPDYSGASDGDVLGISSGAPAWVTPSGGGVLVVHETVTGDDTLVHALDKTYQEIENAGFCVKYKEDDDGPTVVSTLTAFGYNEHLGYLVMFSDDRSIFFAAESKSDFPTYTEVK